MTVIGWYAFIMALLTAIAAQAGEHVDVNSENFKMKIRFYWYMHALFLIATVISWR